MQNNTATSPDAPAIVGALKEATLAALVAFGLFVFLIGIRTDQGPSSALVIVPRFDWLAVFVVAVFLGSLARAGALKEAALGTLVAFGLFSLTFGAYTDQAPTEARVGVWQFDWWRLDWWRFDWLAILITAVIVGGLARALIVGNASTRTLLAAPPPWLEQVMRSARQLAGPALLAFAFAVPILFYGNRYLLDLAILVMTYVMLGWGLTVVVGLAGLLDLGYVAFYAVGAYSYALLATEFGLSFWICLPLAGIFAAFAGVLLGFPVLRLRGDYLAIVTLGFGEIIRLILLNWRDVTGGPNGIANIPRPSFFGLPFVEGDHGFSAAFGLEFTPTHRLVFLFYLILLMGLLTNLATLRLRRLPIGRAWEALREDEIACRTLGINTTNTKLTAFAIGAMFGGFAGAFFATRQSFISPESFNFGESALVLAIVVLGGMGSQLGVAIAAIVMIGGIEALRELSWLRYVFGDNFNPSDHRMLIFGVCMVAIMIWRPRGLVATRTPTLLLADQKPPTAALDKPAHERQT